MNKKGFTLVEMLVVIVILGIIITITATSGFGVFDTAKEKINEENKQTIIEGAKILLVEINNCYDLNDINLNNLLNNNGTSCENIKNETNTISEIVVTLEYLKTNKYVTGPAIDEIEEPSNYTVKINLNGTITLE